MDTPGLLPRADEERNEMELLTLASMQHSECEGSSGGRCLVPLSLASVHPSDPSRPKPETLNPKSKTVDSVVMFVMDLTGGSGEKSSIEAQLDVRDELKERFPDHLWIDVMSKGDLPRCSLKIIVHVHMI